MSDRSPLAVVGRSIPRLDGHAKVTGAARYTADLVRPNMLFGRIVASQVPHARLRAVDIAAAQAAPGVVAVLTAADLQSPLLPGGCAPNRYGSFVRDRALLADGVVRYVGEFVALVVATEERAAAEAARLVDVTYDDLPAATSVGDALRGEVVLHGDGADHARTASWIAADYARNICHRETLRAGDAARALETADFVIKDVLTFPSLYHYAMEPHCALAEVDGDTVVVHASTQAPFLLRSHLAYVFGVDAARVRVVAPYLGGAFGAKAEMSIEGLAVAAAAITKRPVRVTLTQSECAHLNRRHGAEIHIRSGLDAAGRLRAREVVVYLDAGGYADFSPQVVKKTAFRAIGPYRVKHATAIAIGVYTNKVSAGAFRGIGAVQVNWACEAHTDHLAEVVGQDPVAFRRANLLAAGEAYVFGGKLDGDPRACLDACLRAYAGPEAPVTDSMTPSPPWPRGWGVAIGFKDVSASAYEVEIEATAENRVVLRANAPELGGGARTVLVQIAAETLGVPASSVTLVEADTAATPPAAGVFGSRTTILLGAAVRDAARALRRLLETEGAPRPLVARASYTPAKGGADVVTWELTAGLASVFVDESTGRVHLEAYISATDVGRAIHPALCEGQDEGSVAFGVGGALHEELIFEDGQLLNASVIDYRVPRADDMPAKFDSILVENEDGPGPFGSKGVSEGGVAPVAPAIAAAIRDATGVRPRTPPFSAERTWALLAARDGALAAAKGGTG